MSHADRHEVYCANAGDSRAVLFLGDNVIPLSFDHKPTDAGERFRVEAAGGIVSDEGRVDHNLNLSRALGDLTYKKGADLPQSHQKISCVPDVSCFRIVRVVQEVFECPFCRQCGLEVIGGFQVWDGEGQTS
jgi:serine/threonine protein phosphatase PrpC